MTRNIWISIVVVIVLVAGGWWYLNMLSVSATSEATQLPAEQTTLAPSNGAPAGWSAYTSSQYGFSFNYPATGYFSTSDYGSIKTFARSPIAYVQLTDNSQTEGYLTVSVSSDSSDIAKCTSSPGAFVWVNNDPNIPTQYRETLSGNAKNTVINGTTFLQYDVTSHDSIEGAERQYSTVHNGQCVDVRLSAFPSACVNSGCDDRKWSVQTETALLNQLDTIVQTFRFN